MLKMVEKIVEERKIARKNTDEKGPIIDALDVLLRDGSDSNDTERLPLDFISGNIIEMMVPGEETMPTAMTLAVKFLSDCPVALENLMVRNRFEYGFYFDFDFNQRLGLFLSSYIDGPPEMSTSRYIYSVKSV
jgi:hypothetical protein